MRTAMAETSLDAYRSFSTGDLQNKEIAVLNEFMAHPGLLVTREQLADRLGWKECAVCGRVNTLVAKKLLEEVGTAMTASKRRAKLVRVRAEQGALFA